MDSGNANAFGLSSPPAGSTIMDGNLSGLTPAQFNSVIQPQVPAMKTLTAPMPTTLQDDYRYYRSSISDCGIHRTDGKRISFTSHFFRTNIQEDIMFLDNELRSGHNFFSGCSIDEIEQAKAFFNPKQATTERVLKEQFGSSDMEAIKAAIRAEEREKLEGEIKEQMEQAAKMKMALGGSDSSGNLSGSVAAMATTAPLQVINKPLISPQSTTQIAAAAAPAAKA